MRRLTRICLCLFIGAIFGRLGGLPILVFWPLLFPEPLEGEPEGLVAGLVVYLLLFSVFSVGGFLLCWRLTKKYGRERQSSGVQGLFR